MRFVYGMMASYQARQNGNTQQQRRAYSESIRGGRRLPGPRTSMQFLAATTCRHSSAAASHRWVLPRRARERGVNSIWQEMLRNGCSTTSQHTSTRARTARTWHRRPDGASAEAHSTIRMHLACIQPCGVTTRQRPGTLRMVSVARALLDESPWGLMVTGARRSRRPCSLPRDSRSASCCCRSTAGIEPYC